MAKRVVKYYRNTITCKDMVAYIGPFKGVRLMHRLKTADLEYKDFIRKLD